MRTSRRDAAGDLDRHDTFDRPAPGKRSLTAQLAPVQRRAAPVAAPNPGPARPAPALDDPFWFLATATAGVADASAPLPHLDTLKASFGAHADTLDPVRTTTGGAAATAAGQLGAAAYATGDRIGFASPPDLHLAAHEAAHVVQQRAGVALAGGVGAAGDEYERHADAVADAVVAGQSAQPILDAGPRGGGSGVVQLRRRRGAKPGDGAPPARATPLTKYDYEHFSELLGKYGDFTDGGADYPAVVPQDDPELSHLGATVLAVLQLAHGTPHMIKSGIDLWSANAGKVRAVVRAMRAGGASDGFIDQADEGVERIERFVLDQRIDAMVDGGLADSLVGAPDDAVIEATLAAAPAALEQVLALLGKTIEAGEPYVDAMAASGTKVKVETALSSVKLILDLVTLPGTMAEKVAEFRNAGLVGRAATATDIANTVLGTLRDGAAAGVAAGKWLGGITELGDAAETFTQLEGMVGKLAKFGKAVGTITAILGITTSALQLVDGIQRGDKKAIVKAGVGLAEGGLGLLLTATEAGAGPAAVAVWYFTAVEGLIDGVGTMVDAINSAIHARELAAVHDMIRESAEVARLGARMAVAWELSFLQTAATTDAALNAQATARLAAEAEALARPVAARLRGLYQHVASKDADHVGHYPTLVTALGHDALAQLTDDMTLDNPSAQLLTFGCKKVFAGINAMARVAIAETADGDE